MLSAAELLARLNEAALRMSPVAIVFDLEEGGEIVWHRPPKEGDLPAEVEALVRAGGRPLGIIGFLDIVFSSSGIDASGPGWRSCPDGA